MKIYDTKKLAVMAHWTKHAKADNAKYVMRGTCEAGGSIKPRAQAPGSIQKKASEPAHAGGSAMAFYAVAHS